MKTFLSSAICALIIAVLLSLSSPASAVQVGGVTPIKDDKDVRGVWRATVRYQVQGHWLNNMYYTWGYAQITATTQQYCENQLQSWYGSGAQVVTFCWFDAS